jgi:hypothetical protein
MFRLPYRSMACFPPDAEVRCATADPHDPHLTTFAPEMGIENGWCSGVQFCRKCVQKCIPAVTLTFGGGARRLHWCAEHAADADQYRAAADGCECPRSDGKIRHRRDTCTDPVVAQLDWYADN